MASSYFTYYYKQIIIIEQLCDRQSCKQLIYINSLNPHNNYIITHLTDEKFEAQRGLVICPKSHSKQLVFELGLTPEPVLLITL